MIGHTTRLSKLKMIEKLYRAFSPYHNMNLGIDYRNKNGKANLLTTTTKKPTGNDEIKEIRKYLETNEN